MWCQMLQRGQESKEPRTVLWIWQLEGLATFRGAKLGENGHGQQRVDQSTMEGEEVEAVRTTFQAQLGRRRES